MNRIILSALVLTAVCAVALSELCTPDQWEGYEGSLGGYVFKRHPGMITEWSKIFYDAKNKRTATFLDYHNEGYKNKFQMIVRYDDEENKDVGKAFVVDVNKKKCWTKTLRRPFRKACIPEDAKHNCDFSLGGKGSNGIAVSNFIVYKMGVHVMFNVHKVGDVIIPVTENIFGKVMGTDFMQGVGFSEITPGISNATVFDVPKLCTVDEEASIPEFLMREHLIFGL